MEARSSAKSEPQIQVLISKVKCRVIEDGTTSPNQKVKG